MIWWKENVPSWRQPEMLAISLISSIVPMGGKAIVPYAVNYKIITYIIKFPLLQYVEKLRCIYLKLECFYPLPIKREWYDTKENNTPFLPEIN